MTINHYMKLYEKPKSGTGWRRNYNAYNYRHSINAIGGFDTASCDIAIGSRDEGQQFLDQYLGNYVQFMVDDPLNPIWEGFINRMSFDAGNVQYSISLDEMANRIVTTYTDPGVSATAPQTTAIVNNVSSQAIYGIKQDALDLGVHLGTSTIITNLRDAALAQRAFPKTSIAQGQGAGMLHIEMLGFFHTLEWERYGNAAATNVTLSNYLIAILAANLNGTTFFDNSVTSGITTNAITILQNSIRGETSWDRMRMACEAGDGANYYVIGITPTSFSAGTRTFYYRVFNDTIEYTARQSDGLRIRNLYGQIVDPWRVQPDRGVRVSDMLIGWNGVGDNPTETYIMAVDYDANRQTATYRGDDDITAEGVFNFRHYNKAYNKRFGAARRMI